MTDVYAQPSPTRTSARSATGSPIPGRWNPVSVAAIILVWLLLHIGGLFNPGLLDDVDSVYIEIAREMLHRHDFVTPYIDGVRFFDKPPLMYWMAAGSMRLFGEVDWAARLPLALLTLALFLATYALGLRLFDVTSPIHTSDRGALYASLALATSIGPYLYTRFFIPDILLALWMTLGVHLFLVAVERLRSSKSPLTPMLGFAAVMAANVLTKGLIGLVFPIGFALGYLLLTRQLRLLTRLRIPAALSVFLALAAPWHILAALRNPAIDLPSGVELPARGGWAWFYLYNEHIARFFSRRVPHDYGQVPVPLFWLLAAVWMIPWTAFLPGAIAQHIRDLRSEFTPPRGREAALSLLLWSAVVLGFFTLSARQEYYSLPALPAFALMAGGLLARAETSAESFDSLANIAARRSALGWSLWFLVPLGALIAMMAGYLAIAAPRPATGADLATLLAQNPEAYNLSLGHVFDLTGPAMGLFRLPLAALALSMIAIGPGCYLLRRSGRTLGANLTLATASVGLLLCVHEGLCRFYPILGSKGLAMAIVAEQKAHPQSDDLLLIDGEMTAGSTLIFYTREPVHMVNGRVNGPWFGSFWPDAPPIFETDETLRRLWSGPRRLFLLTYHAEARKQDLARFGEIHALASSGGKTILMNRAD